MEKIILSLIILYFGIGGLAIFYINSRGDNSSARERWLKYSVYLAIVLIIVLSILYHFFVIATLLITICGLIEFIKIRKKTANLISGLVPGLIMILCLWGFINFTLFVVPEKQIFVYMLVFIFDGFSQITGQLIGKTKITASISPNKTLEGAIGGFLMTIGTAFVLRNLLTTSTQNTLFLAVLIALLTFAGDILASTYKRMNGVKDYSNFIPGHGGFLDRFDGFILAGAGFWLLEKLLTI